MRKQVLIIGLGHFGMSLAKSLAERGVEVLAVDRQEQRVRIVSDFVLEAACFDASDGEALAKMLPQQREVCVCAIGDESREASIICTALLRQMGARRVIARANDNVHARILSLVGAHEVVNPEEKFGERYASKIIHEEIIGELPLGDGLVVTEFNAPELLIGRTLMELQLPTKFGITIVAIRQPGASSILSPKPDRAITREDVLVAVSREGAVFKLMERN